MRLAIGQLWQETNTFNRNPTTIADFEQWGLASGEDVVTQYGLTGELGGFLDGLRQWQPDAELVGLARFACWPWGCVAENAWREIQSTFVERLKSAGKIDAVFLALHGAMAAANEPDITGALLEEVRRVVGETVPVIGTLDLHAVITPRMLAAADVLVGYHACPHLDSFETGQRAAKALQALQNAHRTPVVLHRKIPMITPAENHNTFTGLPAPLYQRLQEWEKHPDVLSAGLYMAMPWFDVPQLGWSVTVTTTGETAIWQNQVDDLADLAWSLRTLMSQVQRLSPQAAVDAALQCDRSPVVIGDGADATNSGSPGDQTALLAEFLARDAIPRGALTFLVDPEAVATAWQSGEGAAFNGFAGGLFAPEYSDPILLRGTIVRLVKLEFLLDGHIGKNLPIRMGRGAVVQSGDVTILLTEKSGPGSTPKLYETAGLNPREFGIVVAKSPAGFRAEYEPFAAEILLLDGPGCASPHFDRLNFRAADRPLWPLERINRMTEATWCQ